MNNDDMLKGDGRRAQTRTAALAAKTALRHLGRAVREMRRARGWTQVQLAQRILQAEGVDPAAAKDETNNMRVSRIERGWPTTVTNLTGFALAFGYDTVLEWLTDMLGADLSADERKLVEDYRAANAQLQHMIQMLASAAVRESTPAQTAAASPVRRRPRPQ